MTIIITEEPLIKTSKMQAEAKQKAQKYLLWDIKDRIERATDEGKKELLVSNEWLEYPEIITELKAQGCSIRESNSESESKRIIISW